MNTPKILEVSDRRAAEIMAANMARALMTASDEGTTQQKGLHFYHVGRLLTAISRLGSIPTGTSQRVAHAT